MLMQILLPGGKAAADVALGFIHGQDLADLCCQGGVDLPETLGDVLMYGALAHPEPLRRLPHRGLMFNNIIRDLQRPLVHGKS